VRCAGSENIEYYARLRGYTPQAVSALVSILFKYFLLTVHRNKLVRDYSGGSKRKLSFLVACIGDPRVLFLGTDSSVRVGYLLAPVSSPWRWVLCACGGCACGADEPSTGMVSSPSVVAAAPESARGV
jgi:hypothetical protein